MGKRKKKKSENGFWHTLALGLEEETRNSVAAIIALLLAVILILARFELAGLAGEYIYSGLSHLLGTGYLLLPLALVLLAVTLFRGGRPTLLKTSIFGGVLFLLSSLGALHVYIEDLGGLVGKGVAYPLTALFGTPASVIILAGIFLISILVILNTRFPSLGELIRRKRAVAENEATAHIPFKDEQAEEGEGHDADEHEEEEDEGAPHEEEEAGKERKGGFKKLLDFKKGARDEESDIAPRYHHIDSYDPPPLSLLERDRGKPGYGDIKANANIIKRTLQNFNIEVEIDEVSVGPSITRYALKPAEGVRLSRIVALQDDLALALAAHPVRIEAPIPGKSLVGIEIPNARKSTVGLASLLSSPQFRESADPLLISLGRGITGTPTFANLAKAPHLLIAGATGAGKSVSIHALITSLLYRNSPAHLRFILIDPKRVELTLYNKIPHLLTPVITNAKKSILALKWAIKEMERRYNILEAETVRDIHTYHKNVFDPEMKKKGDEASLEVEPMPYIVVIIDELADIMAAYPKELESAIVRLAQMSRAVGIHLVLSTQRPSVNVITGLIKANIPTRVALQVASQVDSRTILDMAGAERLLGAGDMLYLSAEMSKPVRLQSAFITEAEVKRVAKYLRGNYGDLDEAEPIFTEGEEGPLANINLEGEAHDEAEDELYEDARELVMRTGKASTSYLQRKLGLGYARAARLIDMLEERGVVGPGRGSKPRDVLERPIEEGAQENRDDEYNRP